MPAIAFGQEVFVDPAGNDTTGDGSIGNPYLTIAKGLEVLADFSQLEVPPLDPSNPPTAGSSFHQLVCTIRAGTYAENIVSGAQAFPGRPNSITNVFELVRIQAYGGEAVIVQPSAGANVVNLTVNTPSSANPSVLTGPSCFVEFVNLTFDAVNVSGKGVVFDGNSHHCRLYQCRIINGPDDGLELVAGTHDHDIHLSEPHDNTGDGILDEGDNNLIRDCLVHNNGGDGIQARGTGIVERNRCFLNTTGGILANASNPLVRNNFCYTNSTDGITASAGRIYNNTCYANTVNGIGATSPADPQNNICFGNGNDPIGIGSGNLDSGADPLFRDAAGGDFHIIKGSPAIDIGNTLTDVPGDADLRGRPAGPAYDAGAYELPPAGISVAPSIIDTHFALGVGHACTSPMDYRAVQATPKDFTGTPKVGIALCVDPASTPSSFTGYVWNVEPEGGGLFTFRAMRYDSQPLTGLGTVLFSQTHVAITVIDAVMTLVAGTNTLNSTNDLWANIYEATNTILGGVDAAPLPRTNLGFGVVGIGNTVSVMLSGDDIIITTEDGTFTFTLLQAGCQESLTNIAAFENTFTFNNPIAFNKEPTVNFGLQTNDLDVDVLCHCQGEDCYGAYWNSLYDYLEINPQGGDTWGDGVEMEVRIGSVVAGTPRSGPNLYLFQPFTNGNDAITYGVIVDKIDNTIKLVRWINQSLQFYGTILASVSFPMAEGDLLYVLFINSGSIRQAGDPAEWFVSVSQDNGATYIDVIDDLLDSTPFGQICQAPNELMRWRNCHFGLTAVGTQSGNARDVQKWGGVAGQDNYFWMVQTI